MVGGEALRYALDHSAVGAATAIGRRPTGLAHPKLKECSIKTSRTVPHSPARSQARTQRSSAWAPIPARSQTLTNVKSRNQVGHEDLDKSGFAELQ
jgi:hypothetical protein